MSWQSALQPSTRTSSVLPLGALARQRCLPCQVFVIKADRSSDFWEAPGGIGPYCNRYPQSFYKKLECLSAREPKDEELTFPGASGASIPFSSPSAQCLQISTCSTIDDNSGKEVDDLQSLEHMALWCGTWDVFPIFLHVSAVTPGTWRCYEPTSDLHICQV